MVRRMTESVKMASEFLHECPICKGHLKYLVGNDARVDVDCICEQCGREYTMSDLYRRG